MVIEFMWKAQGGFPKFVLIHVLLYKRRVLASLNHLDKSILMPVSLMAIIKHMNMEWNISK